jgi:hypothetical protein
MVAFQVDIHNHSSSRLAYAGASPYEQQNFHKGLAAEERR